MTLVTRRHVLAGSIAETLSDSLTRAFARAPSWPSKPVKFVVPVAAGTAIDLTARMFGEKLATR